MNFKLGDSVLVLDEDLSGTIVKIVKDTVSIETEDGFLLEFQSKELVKRRSDQALKSGMFLNTNLNAVISEKEKPSKRKQPKIKYKERFEPTMEVDLHIHQLVNSSKGILKAGQTWLIVTPLPLTQYNSNFILNPLLSTLDRREVQNLSVMQFNSKTALSDETTFHDITGFNNPEDLCQAAIGDYRLNIAADAWQRLKTDCNGILDYSKPLMAQTNIFKKPNIDLALLSTSRLATTSTHIILLEYTLLFSAPELGNLLTKCATRSLILLIADHLPDSIDLDLSGYIIIDYFGIWKTGEFANQEKNNELTRIHFERQKNQILSTEGDNPSSIDNDLLD